MLSKWNQWTSVKHHRQRLKTMVRYRLLFLTTAPIFLTLLTLIAMTAYWLVHYTWQNTLLDISERLHAANNSIEVIQKEQYHSIRDFTNSYQFVTKLNQSKQGNEIQQQAFSYWVSRQKHRYGLDFLTWHSAAQIRHHRQSKGPGWYEKYAYGRSFFDVLTAKELNELESGLSVKAIVHYLDSEGAETRGLVSRAIIPVRNAQGLVMGYLDGGWLLNNSSKLVERLCHLVYPNLANDISPKGTVTIFLDDLRISTNIMLERDGLKIPAIGTHVADNVKKKVLLQDKQWLDKAYVYDAWYVTSYIPIKDHANKIVGMLYTGYLIWPFISAYLVHLIEIGVVILSVLVLSGVLVFRGSKELFKPIEKIHRVVQQVQLGHDTRIGVIGLNQEHELTLLAKQFDRMLDLLQQRNDEIHLAAQQLEEKVNSRTISLKEKTEQLEHHIKLLNQTRNKLVINEKLAALGELTAGIAHEINNPTAVILGNVELLKLELMDNYAPVEEEIEAILSQIDRIRNITRSLLQYSRHGGVQDEVTWHYINPIIEESITLVKTGSKKHNVMFDVNLQANVAVELNRSQLLQVLVNLQMNALYAIEDKGRISITSENWFSNGQAKGVIVTIGDNGCGIDAKQIKRIFDPFYTTKRDGTGLGLSVSQSIVSRFGGEIEAQSVVGQGSCFKLFLPAKSEHNEALLLPTKEVVGSERGD